MRFKLDENTPTELADFLRLQAHDAVTVLDENLGGSADRTVADVCRAELRTLITFDLDFANIVTYPPASFLAGVIVLRLALQSPRSVLDVFMRLVMPCLGHPMQTPLERHLWVVDETRIRVHA